MRKETSSESFWIINQGIKKCPCRFNSSNSLYNNIKEKEILCKICKNYFHLKCMRYFFLNKKRNFGKAHSIFECPSCFIKDQDPLSKPQKILIEPFLIKNKINYEFFMTDEDKKLLFSKEKDYYIEIRCLKLGEYTHSHIRFPDQADVNLNNIKIKTFKKMEKCVSKNLRGDSSLKISRNFEKKNIKFKNKLNFKFKNIYDNKNTKKETKPIYIGFVALCRELEIDELHSKIVKDNVLRKNEILEIAKQKFNSDMITVQIISKICPITGMTVQTPVRGEECPHFDPIDLKSLIMTMKNNLTRYWKCLRCGAR